MLGWKVLSVVAIVVGILLLAVSWLSWWACKDALCMWSFVGGAAFGLGGVKLWDELKENF